MERDNSENVISIGGAAKTVGLAQSIGGLVKSIVVALIFGGGIVYYMGHGLPVYVGGIVIGILVLVVVLSFFRTIRIATARLGPTATVKSRDASESKISFDPSETVQSSIVGIQRLNAGLASVSVLGTGVNRYPENATIVTEKHAMFIYIPMPGGDKIIGDGPLSDVGKINQAFNKQGMQEELGRMLSSMSIEDIYESDPRNWGIALDDIDFVEIYEGYASPTDPPTNITFHMKDGKTFKYGVFGSEQRDALKKAFAAYERGAKEGA